MKLLLENWKNFLNESVLGDYEGDLEFADDGDLILYHLSTSEDLTSLDPKVARERAITPFKINIFGRVWFAFLQILPPIFK